MQNKSWWLEFRRKMPVVEKWAYFDHAAVAPLSGPALQTLSAWSCEAASNGEVNWSAWRKRVEEVRDLAAKFVGADSTEIALIHNTTEGITLVAEGFPWKPGDNVVTPVGEFPTNLYPWLNLASRGIEVRQVPTVDERVDLKMLESACDERTRIVTISWVGFATGWRNDVDALAEIAHRRGAYLFLDAIQGLGVFPLDVRKTPVDFLAVDGHKWLLGPEGAGIFFVRRDNLELLQPMGVGWNSVQNEWDFSHPQFNLKPSAARFEGGSYNMAGLHALGASLEMLYGYGVEMLSERVQELTDSICERLRGIGANIVSVREDNRLSGIVAVEVPRKDPNVVRKMCRCRGVIVNCRAGRLRVSPHAYNNDEDIDRLIAAIAI